MSRLKIILTFDESWDEEAARNAFEDNDQFTGIVSIEVPSTDCSGCARQNKGSAEQQTDNNGSTCASQIADSIEAACFPVKGEFILPRESWLQEWCRQLRTCR